MDRASEADSARVAAMFRDAQEVLHSILGLTDAAVFAKDLDGRYLFVNERGAEVVGRTPDEIVGRTDDELYEPAVADAFRRIERDVVATRRNITSMTPMPTPDGEMTWMSNVVPLVDGDVVVGVAGLAADVTDQARQDQLLRERTLQLETAQRIARLGTWSWDPETGWVDLSAELSRLLGGEPDHHWTLSELEAITHPDDLADAIAAVRAVRRGDAVDHLFRITRPDGSLGYLRLRSEAALSTSPTDGGSGPGESDTGRADTGGADRGERTRRPILVGTIQDVTEREEAERRRIELERRLQQGQRLETVGQLAGGVAHDFNNLLAVMGMQAELALDDLTAIDHDGTGMTGNPVAERLGELRQTIDRAAMLTQQLLVFSRHDDDTAAVSSVPDVLGRLAPVLEHSLGAGIRLRIETTGDIPPVRVDRAQLEQVLVNLAMNARDAMLDGGVLTVRVDTVPGSGELVRLTVTDTGAGMPPEVRARAFEPFFTTKPVGFGTGLGLATVHGVVTRAGGTVELRSEVGAGTTVELRLPAAGTDTCDAGGADPDTADDGAVDADDEPDAARTVLVVEDLESLGKLAATVLQRAGYRTLLADHPDAALELAAAEPSIDLLLTDVVMPDMSGPALADRLRAECPGLAVLYMTGYTAGMLDLGSREGHETDDGVAVLSKPFTAAALVDAVRRRLADR
ncbi:MAG: ATP-binding protein [Ilumatobacteraceae bacterium]